MNWYVIKLSFTVPVHFGSATSGQALPGGDMAFHADTFFSALCLEALRQKGENGLQALVEAVHSGKLLFSDGFPWKGETLYLPRPVLGPARFAPISSDRKAMKRVSYLPVEDYLRYFAILSSEEISIDPKKWLVHFGNAFVSSKAALRQGEETEPYSVGLFRFADDCGLYVLVGTDSPERFEEICELAYSLGVSGIGGKTSAGYGSFAVLEAVPVHKIPNPQGEMLLSWLKTKNATRWVTLSACLPKDEELNSSLEGAAYQLIRRGGFIQSPALRQAAKKAEQVFLVAGSTFTQQFEGDLYDVSFPNIPHPVYRYGKPVFLGVTV